MAITSWVDSDPIAVGLGTTFMDTMADGDRTGLELGTGLLATPETLSWGALRGLGWGE